MGAAEMLARDRTQALADPSGLRKAQCLMSTDTERRATGTCQETGTGGSGHRGGDWQGQPPKLQEPSAEAGAVLAHHLSQEGAADSLNFKQHEGSPREETRCPPPAPGLSLLFCAPLSWLHWAFTLMASCAPPPDFTPYKQRSVFGVLDRSGYNESWSLPRVQSRPPEFFPALLNPPPSGGSHPPLAPHPLVSHGYVASSRTWSIKWLSRKLPHPPLLPHK